MVHFSLIVFLICSFQITSSFYVSIFSVQSCTFHFISFAKMTPLTSQQEDSFKLRGAADMGQDKYWCLDLVCNLPPWPVLIFLIRGFMRRDRSPWLKFSVLLTLCELRIVCLTKITAEMMKARYFKQASLCLRTSLSGSWACQESLLRPTVHCKAKHWAIRVSTLN